MSLPLAQWRRLDRPSLAFLLVAFFSGVAGSLQIPTLSLFLSSEVQVRPLLVGLFFTVNALMGIAVSQLLARGSDRRGDRKRLIFFCLLLAMLASLLFAFNRDYLVLLLPGVLLASLGSAATPQLFALAREHADGRGRGNVMFSSVLRAQISLAWVIGPPLAFAIAMRFGFTALYLLAAVTFLLCALLVAAGLPSMPKTPLPSTPPLQAPRHQRRAVLRLFISCVLMWSCNGLYLIVMPLYVTQQLQLPEKLAGLMIGLAAGLEIPVMLIAGALAARVGLRRLMRTAVASGILFYAGMLLTDTVLPLLLLQLLNAVFIGILAGIGMIYFQDFMPGQAGAATTLFSNTSRLGWVVSGSLAGSVAEVGGYHATFWLALAMSVATLFFLWRLKEPSPPSPSALS
ncbi:MFS transporter [Pantoea sp. 1.19]|uniref:MFS transporter n=1 Tax=Pantoea sp. 1.19 TaxID=1925589 RepID=UPI000948A256|nr:MFS transporter [Pantoea sp. 1.19]